MANRYAVANGNWSDTATWNGGTLPTSADDVYANNFAVTVNQNIDVISLRNEATTGVTAGGTFDFNTGGVTANISSTIVMNPTVTTQFILITASSGLVTMNVPFGNITSTNTTNSTLITFNGACDFSLIVASLSSGGSTIQNSAGILKTSTGVLNVNGVVQGGLGQLSNYGINSSSGTINITGNVFARGSIGINQSLGVLNITGNVSGGSSGPANTTAIIFNGSTCNILGNVTGGSSGANYRGMSIGVSSILNITGDVIGVTGPIINSSGVINITGNVIGGSNNGSVSVGGSMNITGNVTGGSGANAVNMDGNLTITGNIIGGTGNGIVGVSSTSGVFNHTGICTAGVGGSAIFSRKPSVTTLTGPFIKNGDVVANACQTFLINSLFNPYFEFRKSDVTDVNYVESSAGNFPAELDVRDGTSYASNTLTGTLAVPDPSNVRKGVATDDTVGTADLTAEDMWNYLTSNTFDSGSIGERMKNVSTVASTGAQIASYSV